MVTPRVLQCVVGLQSIEIHQRSSNGSWKSINWTLLTRTVGTEPRIQTEFELLCRFVNNRTQLHKYMQ